MQPTPPPILPSPAPLVEAPAPSSLDPPPKTPAQQRFAIRMWCLFIFCLCAGMLGVGLFLQPDQDPSRPLQMGVHQQLGLPPCGWYLTTGYPCPTCGCTTAVSRISHGQILKGLATQPFGAALALLALILLPLSLFGLLTGRWLGPQPFTLAWYWRSIMFAAALLFLAAWLYKILLIRNNLSPY